MKTTLRYGLIAAILAGGLGVTAANAAPNAQCFSTQEVKETKRVTPREITVRTLDNRYFRITTKNDCRSGSTNDPLVIKTGGASGRICRPVDLTLSSGIEQNSPCLVDTITPITAEQAKAADADHHNGGHSGH